MRTRRAWLVLIVVALALTGAVRLRAQGYTAMAEALSVRFESAVALFTSAQQTRFADMNTRLRLEIAGLKTKAAALDASQTQLEAARRRVEAADSEWRAAKTRSDETFASIEKRFIAWQEETKQFMKAIGDFHERWGLPREEQATVMVPKAQYDQYEREYAPYRQRSVELDARMKALKAEGPTLKALQGTTAERAQAAGRAKVELAALEAAQASNTAEFEAAKKKCEGDVGTVETESKTPPPATPPPSSTGSGSGGATPGGAGTSPGGAGTSGGAGTPGGAGTLTPFPGSGPRLDMPTFVRKAPGVTTSALEQLKGMNEQDRGKDNYFYDCFVSGCAPSGGGTDVVVPAPPPAIPQHILDNKTYQDAATAAAVAEQAFVKADNDLRAAVQSSGTTPAQMQALFAVQSLALATKVKTLFDKEACVRNLSFGIDTSTQGPKPAAPGNASP